MTKALILASGGLDSSVLAYYVKKKMNKDISLLFFDYGQKSLKEELFCMRNLAKKLEAELKVVNLRWLGEISTSLINKGKGGKEEIIKWYVPFRNSVFLTSALAHAESDFIRKNIKQDVYIGIKYEGKISFNDTKPEFLKAINSLAKFSQKGKFRIIAPFINKDKEDIIDMAKKLKVNLGETYSCYLGAGFAKINGKKIPVHCGKCAGCKARKKGFKFSEVDDESFYKD